MYGKRGVQAARLPLEPGGTGSKLTHRAHNAQRSGCRDQAGSSHTYLRRIAAGRNMSMINTTSNWLALFTHSLFRLFLAFAGHWSLSSRPTPHAPRRQGQRGQVVRRPSPTGYCLTPTADLSKIGRGPISTNGPSILSMSPNQAIPAEKSIRCSLLAAVGPLTILSWPEALNASRSKRACRMAIRRNACSLPDFPEFTWCPRNFS